MTYQQIIYLIYEIHFKCLNSTINKTNVINFQFILYKIYVHCRNVITIPHLGCSLFNDKLKTGFQVEARNR